MSVIILAGGRATGKTTFAKKIISGRTHLRYIPEDAEQPDVPVLLDEYDGDQHEDTLRRVKGRTAPVVICCRAVDASDVMDQIPYGVPVITLRATHWKDWEKFGNEVTNG